MKITTWLAGNAGRVIALALLVTAALAVPFLTMEPDESASQEPTGEVFAARDRIEDRFASSVFATFTVIESRDGDLLRVEPLRELLGNQRALQADPAVGRTLFSFFEAEEGVEVTGMRTIADMIDERLPGGLAAADDAAVKQIAGDLIGRFGPTFLGLSVQTTTGPDGPVAPAILAPVLSDDTVLGFGGGGVRLGGDTDGEEYSRDVIELLRGDETSYAAWGIATDVNLTSAEQGEAAGPFIGFTIAAVLAIVGLTFRSYWVLAVTGGALAALIIWLQGISNLIGLEDDLVLSLIVPIAMISFGVDFAFHSVGRYRESQAEGRSPRAAFRVGIAAVSGALVLALASDSAAFLSNTSASIESIVQFGLGAAIALAGAFVLLGIVTPLAIMVIEDKVGRPRPTRRRRIGAVVGSVATAMLAMTSVLLSVFILPVGGVVALAVYLLVALVLPYRLATPSDEFDSVEVGGGRAAEVVGATVVAITRRRAVVLTVVGVLTVGAAILAVRVPTEFDVKDFFAADTDFVVGLDKLDEHGGPAAGEPADILIETDLTDPVALAAIQSFVDDFRAIDSDRFQRGDDGMITLEAGVIDVLGDVVRHPAAIGAIQALAGVTITDVDGDGLPDDTEQIEAAITVARDIGVPINEQQLVRTPDDVRGAVWTDGSNTATRMSVGLPGSRLVENIVDARADLAPLVAQLESDLRAVDPSAEVTVTGGPVVRQESLDAISRALQVSLPIAVVICLLIAATFMRSLRLALTVIVPILVVVAWLYAFMYVFGFAINLVTATIGAVSIGIGIDFAIHFTERYREELDRLGDRMEAVRAAAEGTGLALVASAMSSIVGFAILAFAPMPLFASYGFLTAVMIGMAGLASLAVLPPLLTLVTRDRSEPARLDTPASDVHQPV